VREKPKQALIATVGRTRNPVEASILEHAPELVLLIASQDTMGVASELREAFPELEVKAFLLDDPESLRESFRLARRVYLEARERGAQSIVADITGGTKPMTAGLTLALSGLGVVFSYVGGERRDPVTGRVQSGAERVRQLEDPTERYLEAEWRAFKSAWNGWRMDTATEVLGRILRLPTLSSSEKRFYGHLREVAVGMGAWDRFHHRSALEKLEGNIPIALAIAEAWRHGAKVRVLSELEGRLGALRKLVEKEGKPTFHLLADLLANAERRAAAGRYDDALARLYRALELAAEADLYHHAGVVLRDPATWPDTLGNDLRERARKLAGLKSVLDLVFDIELRLGHQGSLGQRIWGMLGTLEPLLERRHKSILAHGSKPVGREDYQAFRKVFEELDLSAMEPWPVW